jgi:hypothetical protein
VDLQIIDRGFVEWTGLAQTNGMTARLADFRTSFQDTSLQIDRLIDYKNLHDQLQRLELSGYEVIEKYSDRFPEDEVIYDIVRGHKNGLAPIVDKIQRLGTRPTLSDEMRWISDLIIAYQLLADAVAERDAAPLRRFCEIIKRVLAQWPGQISAQLIVMARSLEIKKGHPLDVILASSGQPSAEAKAIAHSLTEFNKYIQRLNLMVVEHGKWQDADRELRLLRSTGGSDLDHLRQDWGRVKRIMEPLVSNRDESWAQDLMHCFAKVDIALEAAVPSKTKERLEELMSATRLRFLKVDDDLRGFCGELRGIGLAFAAVGQSLEETIPATATPTVSIVEAPIIRDVPIQRRLLLSEYAEGNTSYEKLTQQIEAVDKDIRVSGDSETKLRLTWKRATLEAERAQVADHLAHIEKLMASSGSEIA